VSDVYAIYVSCICVSDIDDADVHDIHILNVQLQVSFAKEPCK